jgi:prevent-host-death family protein
MERVSIREFKSKLSAYLRQVEKGENLIVTSRRQPVAQVTAYGHRKGRGSKNNPPIAMDGVEWDGIPPILPTDCPKLEAGETAAQAVLENRR